MVALTGQSGGRHGHELIDLAFDAMFTRSWKERTITSWNEGAERLYGWTRSEAMGRRAAELLGSRYPIPLDEIEDELRRSGRWQGEIVQRRKDGSPVTVNCRWGLQTDANGDPLAILEINSDLTSQRSMTERLRGSEERFALLVSAVIEYAIFMLDTDGTVISWNEGAQRIKRYTADEIIGRHFSVFYTPEDRTAGLPQRALAVAEREGTFLAEGWRMRKDGSRFWASVVITALRDATGMLTGFGKVTRDITDKHREEERLRDYAREMAELEQSKARFLDLAAHELRGPLTLIRGYNSLLEEGKLDPARIPEIALMLEGRLEQIDLMVAQMLEMGRVENEPPELHFDTIDLCDVTQAQIRKLRPLASGRSIRLEGNPGDQMARADESRIGTVIANLLDNAIKYSPEHSEIVCNVGRHGSKVFVAVRDPGPGIAPQHVPMLFKRYTRLPTAANRTISGTGLGLYLCQEIAKRHGGEITVDSQLGEGSVFTLWLPAVDVTPTPSTVLMKGGTEVAGQSS